MKSFELRSIVYAVFYGISLGNVVALLVNCEAKYGFYAFVYFLFGTLHEIIYELKKFNDKNK